MQINRLLSATGAFTLTSAGLMASLVIGAVPVMLLSILGLGPLAYLIFGLLGLGSGFALYTKLCRHFNCWPLYKPPLSGIQKALSYVRTEPNPSFYDDVRFTLQEFEKERQKIQTDGFCYLSIEWQNEEGPLSNQMIQLFQGKHTQAEADKDKLWENLTSLTSRFKNK